MDKAKLTADEIHAIETIQTDRLSVERSLEVAMNYATNQFTQIRDREVKLWDNLIERFQLDHDKNWKVRFEDGCHQVVEAPMP